MSNVKQGNYYKRKTKDYFIKLGYDCEYLEKYTAKYVPGRGMFHKKSDIFGCDGLAMNRQKLIFWNSKSTEDIEKRRNEVIKSAISEFTKYSFPVSFLVERWVVIWSIGARAPEIHRLA